MQWEQAFAVSSGRLRSSAIRELLALTAQPDVISFAGGLPAPELFPCDDLHAAFAAVLDQEGDQALQYGPTEGDMELRAYLVQRLALRGIQARPEEVLITTGSQQGLDLLGALLLGPAMTAVVETPSYVGALQAFARSEPHFATVPLDSDGMQVEAVAELLASPRQAPWKPALVYTIPTYQNPSGVTMTLARRRQLLELSRQHNLPLVEDDPYSELRYEGEPVPPVRALAGGDDVIHLGTFSKILAPGLRLGWVVAPAPVIQRLVIAKQGADLHTNSLVQRAVLAYCRRADLNGHIERLRLAYRQRRDAMLAALERYFPAGTTWTTPQGGIFLWLTLPAGADSTALLAEALHHGVAFVPGAAFSPPSPPVPASRTLRLNFSHAKPEQISDGIERLAFALRLHLERAA